MRSGRTFQTCCDAHSTRLAWPNYIAFCLHNRSYPTRAHGEVQHFGALPQI